MHADTQYRTDDVRYIVIEIRLECNKRNEIDVVNQFKCNERTYHTIRCLCTHIGSGQNVVIN